MMRHKTGILVGVEHISRRVVQLKIRVIPHWAVQRPSLLLREPVAYFNS